MSGLPSRNTPQDPLSRALDALPLVPLHYFLIAAVCAGHMFEVIEMVMSSVFATTFAPQVKAGLIEQSQLALLLSAGSFGAAIGAPLLGSVADRLGRRFVLVLALILVAICSVAGALSQNIEQLIVTRMIASLGIGCYVPLAASYLTELVPARARGRAVLVNLVIGGVGATASSLLTRSFNELMPFGLDGWRASMLVGALGSLAVAVSMIWLPESPRWLLAVGRKSAAEAIYRRLARLRPDEAVPDLGRFDPPAAKAKAVDAAAAGPLWTPQRLRLMAFFVLLSALSPWALSGFPLLAGVLFSHRGYDTQFALLLHSLTVAGVSAGALASMFFVDRFRRDAMMIACGLGTALAGVAFIFTEPAAVAATIGMVFTALVAVYFQVQILYCAELFPPLLRGKAPAICYGVNRGVSILVPWGLLPLLSFAGEVAVMGLMSGVMAVSAILILLFLRRGDHDPEIRAAAAPA